MKSAITKRSVVVGGHKTSVSLEDAFWNDIQAIAHMREMSISHLLREIDENRKHSNLSSAVRVYVLLHHRARHAEQPQPAAHPATPSV